MPELHLDLWLYGRLAAYGGEASQGGYANLTLGLPTGSCMRDLLHYLRLPDTERGITFINGQLSALPGLHPDLDYEFRGGERVAIFDRISMWPFQYRDGAAMTDALQRALEAQPDGILHHTYETQREPQSGAG